MRAGLMRSSYFCGEPAPWICRYHSVCTARCVSAMSPSLQRYSWNASKEDGGGKIVFALLLDCYLWGAPVSPLGRPVERAWPLPNPLSPHSNRNALCMVMQPNPTIRWSRLTGTSRQQTDSMAVSMLRQHPHAHQSHPHDPKVELEPEIDPPPPGGSRTVQA